MVVELVVHSTKETVALCRFLDSGEKVSLRTRVWGLVPGELLTVAPRKSWKYGARSYLSGKVLSSRLDVAALGLRPLALTRMGAHGRRQEFEMEQILPGEDPEDPFSDPILESNDCKDAGDYATAKKILMELCAVDLRCLDAHAHLGNLLFDSFPDVAGRHYAVGVGIGELSLGVDFGGLLPWGLIDNRPFLRCMHGLGLCLWRTGQIVEAERVFDRMLRLNPADNQGARFVLHDVRGGVPWSPERA